MPVLLALLAVLLAVPELVSVTQGPEWEKLRQQINRLNPAKIIGAQDAAEAAARSIRDYVQLEELAARDGLDEHQFRLLVDLRKQYATVADMFTAFFRGSLTAERLAELLARLGLDDEQRAILASSAEVIPQVSDVVRFLTRDVFIPEFVEAFGMDLELPPDAAPHFARLGMSRESMVNFWRAHWELPGLHQGYEMFQRDQISELDLRRLMRAQGVEPFWRDPLIAISYDPIGRIDIRRFHALGVITDSEVIRLARMQGYSPESAALYARWVIAYNAQHRRQTARDHSAAVEAHIVTSTIARTLTEAEARKMLDGLGVSDAETGKLMAEAALSQAVKRHARIAQSIAPFFVDSFWTEAETRAALGRYGFNADEIVTLLEDWQIDRDLHALKVAHHADRDLTKGEIVAAYKDHILDAAETRRLLTDMRYDEREVRTIVAIADYQAHRAEVADEIEVVHRRVVAGKISEAAASSALDQIGARPAHRDALIARWLGETTHRQADLTVAQLTDLYKLGLWDEARVAAYLPRLGYDVDEQHALLALMGARAAEATIRAQRAAGKSARASQRAVGGAP